MEEKFYEDQIIAKIEQIEDEYREIVGARSEESRNNKIPSLAATPNRKLSDIQEDTTEQLLLTQKSTRREFDDQIEVNEF